MLVYQRVIRWFRGFLNFSHSTLLVTKLLQLRMGDFGSPTAKGTVLTNCYGLLDNVDIDSMHHQNDGLQNIYIYIYYTQYISPCQFPLKDLGARAPNNLDRFFITHFDCLGNWCSDSIEFWFPVSYPIFGFSTKYHRDGGSDSIGGKILLKKSDFVEGVFFCYQIEQVRRSLLWRPFIFWMLSTMVDHVNE